jgi:hypothetical protein
MGSYKDKLSYKERWEVIHYIRSLQAQAKKAEYSPTGNTLNNEAMPWAAVESSMMKAPAPAVADTTGQHGEPAPQHTNQH